jgi:hypothetical protein
MNHLFLRIWLMVSCTLALSAVIVCLAWEIHVNPFLSMLPIVITLIIVIAGTSALIIYLLISPSVRKINSLPVRIWTTGIFTAGVIASVIHYIRYVPSIDSHELIGIVSIAIATLLLLAAVSGYLAILWFFWLIRVKKRH